MAGGGCSTDARNGTGLGVAFGALAGLGSWRSDGGAGAEKRRSTREVGPAAGRALRFAAVRSLLGRVSCSWLLFAAAGCSARDGAPRPSEHVANALEPAFDPARWPGRMPELFALDGAPHEPWLVYLDAGHGAPDNTGNLSAYCELEQDFTASLAADVALELEASQRFRVVASRVAGETVTITERVAAAEMLAPRAFVSLHSDVRGRTDTWEPAPGASCPRSFAAPGFGVFYSDEGPDALVGARRALASALAGALRAAGFLPYSGASYGSEYLAVEPATGVFVDRHEPDKRIYVLRATTMPAVLVETHNAHDPREAAAWNQARVRRAFALALGRGLEGALAPR